MKMNASEVSRMTKRKTRQRRTKNEEKPHDEREAELGAPNEVQNRQ
jgi:hypothetical protein